ncbi:MAG: argininosuccinate synthase [Candidatus Schekmanbacteria bacterium RIFCSPHIGHO2_02_FULL_38_11]|uniref:Argininosuccinate synthase n=1 Tax=Candidatus Schekmanbacteria bacterium RIFCSPLOWO2_12_FULL_38_15 TaxID=1817883 RepID=A0A1F7SHX7_9BACT|nr:MAG: argininosuccinate synthase [Candidatus Schekmanbacteria bacterium GWA2_38_9]OGL50829.1 MAG: argininosuccinate synthase [Candidatus Schekmanbacteria bacterium RIFCSPLOWO2_02_FULL_38_14]OGL53410.1 MAG: argininosuccinate synthase [Candidatus Schekmanbacteria bacterium RIFCSPLOWO2_12_FULL_38_15]OGL55762.1 MAG: argininosuccinate synthase [Candidatus Schekmanbacteria bacterium RIFCSPHIGHO2_02_FULL_38_11]
MRKVKKVVLAYSGGLDTSVILRWLIETYECEVIAFCADLGQGEELKKIKEKAIKTGASKVYVEDLKEEFARNFVFPIFRGNALYEGKYLLGTSIARPLIAKKQIEIAKKEKADSVSHGATGKGNDQVRFELAYHALYPGIKVVAPWREWELNSRKALVAYAKRFGIPVPVSVERPYSSDRNMLHISFEGGILEDPWREPPEDMYLLTRSPQKAPDKPTYIEIDFEKGNAVAVNGKRLSSAKLLEKLNSIGGINGVGRVDLVENRYVGMKSRGVYETPGGTILHIAHRGIESITMDREIMYIRDSLIPDYSRLVYFGYWFSPERELLQKMIDETQKYVTGRVRLKIYKGNCDVVGRKSPQTLYRHDFVTFEEDSVYNQADATGFINLNALRLKINAISNRKGFLK